MAEQRIYTIKNSRLKNACLKEFSIKNDTLQINISNGEKAFCYLAALDGAEENQSWGRIHICAEFMGHLTMQIYAMALNEKSSKVQETDIQQGINIDIEEFFRDDAIENEKKEELFLLFGGIRAKQQKECLLYSLKGRYLWIALTVEGEGSGEIQSIKVYQKGDDFMDAFPEVYQERNSFFHRYLSVFSAVYQDFGWELEHIYERFDPDTAQYKELLELACWLGLDVKGDFLGEAALRVLIKQAYLLNKYKGTKAVLQRVIEIVLGEPAIIREKCIEAHIQNEEEQKQKEDIVILIKTEVEQKQKTGLLFLLEQFKPMKCSMRIIFLKKGGRMDEHTYMDVNAMTQDLSFGYLDKGQTEQNIKMK